MKRIVFPIKHGTHGEAVADLQDALQRLLDNSLIPMVPAERHAAVNRLRAERAEAKPGEQTRKLVAAFQQQLQLHTSGTVDQETAAQLNTQLERIGALPPLPTPPPTSTASAEPAVAKLLPLLRTSPALAAASVLDKFTRLFAAKSERDPRNWPGIAKEAGLSASQIEELGLTLEFAALTDRDPHLVAELQALRASGRISAGRDLVEIGDEEWRAMLKRAAAAGPDAAADPTARLATIASRLRANYPMAYVARVVAAAPTLDPALLRRVVEASPKLDLARRVPETALAGFGAEERSAAAVALESLRREINAYPDFDYRAAMAAPAGARRHDPALVNPIRQGVSRFLAQAPDFDFRTAPVAKYLTEHPQALKGLSQPTSVTAQLQRMQRVFRVAPDADAMSVLMGEGIHSAFRISRMPAEIFVANFAGKLGGDGAAQRIYAAARTVAATTAAIGWTARLRSAGPLPAAVGAWPPPDLQIADAKLARLLSPGGGRSNT